MELQLSQLQGVEDGLYVKDNAALRRFRVVGRERAERGQREGGIQTVREGQAIAGGREMLTLIIGGSASGKSEYAEQHVLSLERDGRQMPRIYIASMEPFGEEAKARIVRHHRMRAQRGFSTIECYTGLGDVLIPPGSNVLLEDMGNLAANEMFSPAAAGNPVPLRERILTGVDRLLEQCAHLTIVTNEIFSDGTVYEEETVRYQKELAVVNREIAGRADLVVEVVCGLPNVLKGVLQS